MNSSDDEGQGLMDIMKKDISKTGGQGAPSRPGIPSFMKSASSMGMSMKLGGGGSIANKFRQQSSLGMGMSSGGINKVGGNKHLFLGKTLSLHKNKTLNLS
jgi:hypothetical protein